MTNAITLERSIITGVHDGPDLLVIGGVHGDDPERGAQTLHDLAAIGVTRFVQGLRYTDADEFLRGLDAFQRVREAAKN